MGIQVWSDCENTLSIDIDENSNFMQCADSSRERRRPHSDAPFDPYAGTVMSH